MPLGRSVRKLFSENPRGVASSPLCRRGLMQTENESGDEFPALFKANAIGANETCLLDKNK